MPGVVYKKSTDEHTHQWMDKNGWEIRKAYIQDIKGTRLPESKNKTKRWLRGLGL